MLNVMSRRYIVPRIHVRGQGHWKQGYSTEDGTPVTPAVHQGENRKHETKGDDEALPDGR